MHAVIQTQASAADTARHLSTLVRRPLTIHQWLDNRQTAAEAAIPFVGRVWNGRFKFHRVITGRNSFLPIISGEVVATDRGAQLRMTLRLNIAVAMFELAMLASIVDGMVKHGFEWTPVLIIVLILAMTVGFFLQEKRRAITILRREFDKY